MKLKNGRFFLTSLCFSFLLWGCGGGGDVSDTQTYRLTLENRWNSTNFDNFPGAGKLGRMVVVGHTADFSLWRAGELATTGLRVLAEANHSANLENELTVEKNKNEERKVSNDFTAVDFGSSPLTVDFTMHKDFPLLSLALNFEPTPDWFAGVAAVKLFENENWKESVEEFLLPYDAGSKTGGQFADSSSDQIPQSNIVAITSTSGLINKTDGGNKMVKISVEKR